ncbi:MAG: glycosyltransferase family 87 protein [Chthoniobacteraceae bacterium]
MFSRELQNKLAPHTKTLRLCVTGVGIITILVLWILTMIKARGDFLLHWEFGHRLVHGIFLYTNGMHLPYPPSWAMLFAPFSMFPQRVAMPLFLVLGFSSLVLLFKILIDLTRKYLPQANDYVFWLIAATLLITSRFVIRDLADGGENLFINALTWGGLFFFIRRRPVIGGALLGLAIALKCTPLLFTGYFILKRQWVAAVSTLAFAILFFLSPILIQGPQSYIAHITFWKNNVLAGISEKDPSVGILGPEQLHNKALKPMLARFLMRLPDGHPGRFPGAAHIDFLRLTPSTANLVIKLITLLSGLAVVWCFSRSPREFESLAFLWECAIVSLLMLLFSPITWGEHCVGVIPAVYLILMRVNSRKSVAPWMRRSFILVVAIFIALNRSFIGFTLSELLESYHAITFCLIALAAIAFALWSEAKDSTIPPSPAT